MSDSNDSEKLDAILKKSQDKTWKSLLPEELNVLITAFLPSHPFPLRSNAYIVLSAFCQRLRETTSSSKQQPDAGSEAIVKVFASSFVSKLGETTEPEVLSGLTFLAALFQVDWQAASIIFTQDGIVDTVADAVDIFPVSSSISLAVAELLAQAAGHKSCRPVISSQCIQWLEAKCHQTEDNALRAAAAVALVKLSRGAGADASNIPGTAKPTSSNVGDEELVKLMKGLVVSGPDTSSLGNAIEGLAYMSVNPSVKEVLSSDKSFLSRLFAIIPRRQSMLSQSEEQIGLTPLYGAVLIISNLCAHKPRLTQEEAQIAKLRHMANTPGESSKSPEDSEKSVLEDDEHALMRGRRLIKAGVLDALTAAVKVSDSRAVRLLVGRTLLSLAEDKESRGQILQAGGAKALTIIIQSSLPSSSSGTERSSKLLQLDPSDIEPIQALAKLAITASPVQVFGPNAGALYDAIRPFALMLVHPSSNLLQQFEAMMALTNLSSAGPEASDRIGKAEDLMNKVELLMLEDHTLIRRAAMELVCNLVAGSEEIFNRYGGEKDPGSKSKLQVLVALCDVEDLQTRLAASGALAQLTSSPDACQFLLELQRERHRVLPVFGQLIDPSIQPPHDEATDDEEEVEEIKRPEEADSGLVHRGVVCISNFLAGIEDVSARKELAEEVQRLGIVQALVRVFKSYSADRSSPVLRPTAEALKYLMESGIPITI